MKFVDSYENKYNFTKTVKSGSLQPNGTYKCCNCGQKLYLDKNNYLPQCPKCNSKEFEII